MLMSTYPDVCHSGSGGRNVLFLRLKAASLPAPSFQALAAAAEVHQRPVPWAAWAEGEVEGQALCRVCALAAQIDSLLFPYR
jgi:hypothetical protein